MPTIEKLGRLRIVRFYLDDAYWSTSWRHFVKGPKGLDKVFRRLRPLLLNGAVDGLALANWFSSLCELVSRNADEVDVLVAYNHSRKILTVYYR